MTRMRRFSDATRSQQTMVYILMTVLAADLIKKCSTKGCWFLGSSCSRIRRSFCSHKYWPLQQPAIIHYINTASVRHLALNTALIDTFALN